MTIAPRSSAALRRPRLPALPFALLLTLLVGCNRGREVREWTPEDHDQPASSPNAASPRSAPGAAPEANLIEIAWERNCASCHGARGRGDGPQGPMMRAPDLTRAEWQAKVSDQEIKDTIRNGRNRMPAFDLPASVIDGLVQRIRANRQR